MSSPLLSLLGSRPFVWACGVGGLPRRCPISSIGRLSSSVRCLSLCIRHAWRDRYTPPRPYDAKCGCFVLALLESEVFTCCAVSICLLVGTCRYSCIPLFLSRSARTIVSVIPFRYTPHGFFRDLLISWSRGLVSHTPPVLCSAMSRRVGCYYTIALREAVK